MGMKIRVSGLPQGDRHTQEHQHREVRRANHLPRMRLTPPGEAGQVEGRAVQGRDGRQNQALPDRRRLKAKQATGERRFYLEDKS